MERNQSARILGARILLAPPERVVKALALGLGLAFLVISAVLPHRSALACANVGTEVALTPERRELFEKRIERARKDLVAAQKELEKVDQRIRNKNSLDDSERNYLTKHSGNWKKEIEIQEAAIRQAELVLRTGKERIHKSAPASSGAQQDKGC